MSDNSILFTKVIAVLLSSGKNWKLIRKMMIFEQTNQHSVRPYAKKFDVYSERFIRYRIAKCYAKCAKCYAKLSNCYAVQVQRLVAVCTQRINHTIFEPSNMQRKDLNIKLFPGL